MKSAFEHKIQGQKYQVMVEYKNNKNQYIRVKEDLTILVTTNIFNNKRSIIRTLIKEEDYLIKAIEKMKKKQEKENEFYYLGKKYDIIKVPFDNIEIEDNKIYYPSEKALEKWVKKQTEKIFKERLEYCHSLFEEDILFPKLKIRSMKTRWGVCNKRDDSVTLNSKLIRYPIYNLDYVIIHELSHLVHFDHSKEFWKTVGKYMPDYKKSVKELKE